MAYLCWHFAENAEFEMTPDGRQTWGERFFALGLGGAAALLAWFSGNSSELPPELWDEVAVALHLRPPVSEFPLLWQNVVSRFISAYGINSTLFYLKLSGPLSLGVLAAMSFRLFCSFLPPAMIRETNRSSLRCWIVRLVLAQGVLLFVCSQPVWLAGRVFSPEMMKLMLMTWALLCAFIAVERSSLFYIVFTGIVSGVLMAETPLAVLPIVFCWGMLYRGCESFAGGTSAPIVNPIVLSVAVRWMMIAFFFGWIAALSFNVAFYLGNGGGGEVDSGVFLCVVRYFINYLTVVKNSASLLGFLLIAVVVILPAIIIMAKMRDLANEEKLLSFPYAVFAVVAMVVAFLQSTGFNGCRFWDWEPNALSSPFIGCLCLLSTSIIVVQVLSIFVVDLFFRDHAKLLEEEFPGAADGEELALKTLKLLQCSIAVIRMSIWLVPVVVLVGVLPFRFVSAEREMSAIINAVAAQTAAECEGASMVFTDGSLDAAVEVASAQNGGSLKALSMMSAGGRYDAALRTRGETNEEFRAMLEVGTADALRMWVYGGHAIVSNVAIQVGIELWRHARLPLPAAGGLVFRNALFPDGAAEKWAASARDLARRAVDFSKDNDLQKCAYPQLRQLFSHCQWRLSRMCRMRANEAEVRKDTQASRLENDLADKLDESNEQWREVREKMNWVARQGGVRLSPREGLKLGLERADFRMAGAFAERVLKVDADDMQANFAMGMNFMTSRKYTLAEKHLKKCLLRSPNEPAVLNNLAVAQLRLKRYEEARTNALRALELYPDSPEIKETLRHINAAKNQSR